MNHRRGTLEQIEQLPWAGRRVGVAAAWGVAGQVVFFFRNNMMSSSFKNLRPSAGGTVIE
jgi:hypothetical protein